MRQFLIRELEQLTGIKPHTIRTWEKRYGVFTPDRNHANVRRYCLKDVCFILDIALLMQYGHKISKLVSLKDHEIQVKIQGLKPHEAKVQNAVYKLIKCMFLNNIDEFEAGLNTAVAQWGIDTVIHKVIIPFLERVQVLSYKDSSAEAHFVVTV